MALNLLGLLCVSVFYFFAVLFGFCAYRCIKKAGGNEAQMPRTRSNVTEVQAFPYSESRDVMSAVTTAGTLSPDSHALWQAEKAANLVSPLRPVDSLSESSDEEARSFPPGKKFFLANGSIGWVIGSTSLLATRTGGLFVNATAQEAYNGGLVWCLFPISWFICIGISCILFSNMPKTPMITAGDWFQATYGRRTGAVFALPVILAELLTACIIFSYITYGMQSALGVNSWVSSLLSAFTVFVCLCASGLPASLISDGLQLMLLWVAVLTLTGSAERLPVTKQQVQPTSTVGVVDGDDIGHFIDSLVVLSIGCVPLQSNYQRIIPMLRRQNYVKMLAALFVGTVFVTVPSILLGFRALKQDWKNVTNGRSANLYGSLPAVIPQLFLTTSLPSDGARIVVTGALSAGFLASCDSSIFAASTAFAQNVFKGWLKPQAYEKDLIIVARLAILCFALLAAVPAALNLDIYACWLLPFDILAVSVFPQLFCITYVGTANTYGAAAGFTAGTLLRISLGDRCIHLPALIELPFSDPVKGPLLPFRTTCVVVNLIVTISVSSLYQWLYETNRVTSVQDIFLCFMSEEKRLERAESYRERCVEKVTTI